MTGLSRKEVCERFGISNKQLRYWRNRGLVAPSLRTEGGHYRYSASDVIALRMAKAMRRGRISVKKLEHALPISRAEVESIVRDAILEDRQQR